MSGFRPISVAWSVVRWLVLWALIALLFWALAALLPGIDVPSFEASLLTTALIALLNAFLWPLLIRLLLPLTVITFGLGSLVLNAAIVSISIKVIDGSAPDFFGRRAGGLSPLRGPDGARASPQYRRRRPPASPGAPKGASRPREAPKCLG